MESLYYEVVCVSTDTNDVGFKRFIDTAYKYNLNIKILGLDCNWEGGDMNNGIGGGQKVNLLKEYLNNEGEKELEKIIIFTDSYDVIFECGIDEIHEKIKSLLNKYNKHIDNVIIFSSEKTCWPNKNYQSCFENTTYGYNYLNSGGIICKASNLKKLLENIKNNEDDQEYYTKLFLNLKKTNSDITPLLDSNCLIFQTLNNSYKEILFNKCQRRLININTNTKPCIIHANGPKYIKDILNNYYDNTINKIFYKNKISIMYC